MELFLIYYLAKYNWPCPAFKFSKRAPVRYQKLEISSINPVCINQEESLSDDWRVNHDKSHGYDNTSRNFGEKVWPKIWYEFRINQCHEMEWERYRYKSWCGVCYFGAYSWNIHNNTTKFLLRFTPCGEWYADGR